MLDALPPIFGADTKLIYGCNFVAPLKVCVGFSIFDSVSFSLKFKFLFSKRHGLFDLKMS